MNKRRFVIITPMNSIVIPKDRYRAARTMAKRLFTILILKADDVSGFH